VNYEDFFDEDEVMTYKRVKRGTMILARVARDIAADMVQGTIYGSGKEFVHTTQGMFRLAMAENSDNSTEQIAHTEMGAVTIIMGSRYQMRQFFKGHGLNSTRAYNEWYRRVQQVMSGVTV